MKRGIPVVLMLIVVSGLTMVVLPVMGAEDTSTCFVDSNGQIVCQERSTSDGGNANTCSIDPDDGSGLPECGTPKDNECYPGGVLAGKCDSEWHWKGGWWLARFYHFGLSRADFPAEFVSLLPPLPEVEESAPATRSLPDGCFDTPSFTDQRFVGPPDTLNNSQDMNSFDGSCTGGVKVTYTSVFASSLAEAISKCLALGASTGSVANFSVNGYTVSSTGAVMPSDLYWCYPFA